MGDDFYIGYQDKPPKRISRFIKWVVLGVFILLIGIAVLLIKSQRGFNNHEFEFGKLTEVSGLLTIKPVPMLTTSDESILLIDYGKFGAEKTLYDLFEDNLNDKRNVKLLGTLIKGDGRTLLELTKGKESILEVNTSNESLTVDTLGQVVLSGEIIDPKCYFGVMKPGEGKIHRSCAIRCISGGIPPVLKYESKPGKIDYAVIKGANGQMVNHKVLDFVAEPIQLSGFLYQFNTWKVIYLDELKGIQRL